MGTTGAVLGGTLQAAANAYLHALLDEPYEKERLAKAQLENERLRAQNELTRAQTGYYTRRPGSGSSGSQRLYKTPEGWWDRDSGELVYKFGPGPAKPLKELEIMRGQARKAMEAFLGKDFNEFDQSDFAVPEIQGLLDVYYGHSDVGMGPTGGYRRGDIRRRLPQPDSSTPSAPTPPPGVTPSTTPPAAQSPPQPAGTEAPRTSTPTPPVGPRQGVLPSPKWMQHYRTRFERLPQSEADAQWETMRTSPGVQAENIVAFIEAYRDKYGQDPPGVETVTERPAGGPVPTRPAPGAAPPAAGTIPTAPATSPGVEPGTLPVIETPAQKRMRELREEKEQRDKEDQLIQQRTALQGPVKDYQAQIALELFNAGQIDSAYYPKLQPQQQQKVNDVQKAREKVKRDRDELLLRGKQMALHNTQMKLAAPYIQELEAMDRTAELTNMILPLLSGQTVGVGGQVTSGWNVLAALLPGYKSPYRERAIKELRDRGITGKLQEAQVAATIAAQIEHSGNAPEVMGRMFVPGVAGVEVLSSILAYMHALTLKRMGGSGGRQGITVQDIKEAHNWFDPRLLRSTPDILRERLEKLRQFIEKAREPTRRMIRTYHLDPDKEGYPLLDYNPESAKELEPPRPALTPDQEQLLLEGAR